MTRECGNKEKIRKCIRINCINREKLRACGGTECAVHYCALRVRVVADRRAGRVRRRRGEGGGDGR